jgi:hypothetical protein
MASDRIIAKMRLNSIRHTVIFPIDVIQSIDSNAVSPTEAGETKVFTEGSYFGLLPELEANGQAAAHRSGGLHKVNRLTILPYDRNVALSQ